MEEKQINPIATLTPEEVALDRKKKSLNRIFGALLILAIILGGLLIYEIILLFI